MIDEHVTQSAVGAGNGDAKALTVIGSALVGGDCIDDVNVLRAVASRELFDQARALSMVGT